MNVRDRGSRKAADPVRDPAEGAERPGLMDRINAFGERNAKPIIITSTVLVIVTVLIIADSVYKRTIGPKAEKERAAATSAKELQELKERYRSVPGVLPQIILTLGHQLYKENKLEEARKEYEEFATRWPDHPLKEIAVRSRQKIDDNLKYSESSREAALHAPDLAVHPLTTAKLTDRIAAVRGELKGLKGKIDAESQERAKRLGEELDRLLASPLAVHPAKEAHPILVLKTKEGVIRIELFEDEAPNAVAQLVDLAGKKYFDGLKFKVSEEQLRLIPNDKMPVAGALPFERSGREGDVGSVVLVRKPDGSGNLAGEFVILLKDRPLSNETVAGIVLDNGLHTARQLKEDHAIESAAAEGLRDHEYKPSLK